jgi:hypothetical protein
LLGEIIGGFGHFAGPKSIGIVSAARFRFDDIRIRQRGLMPAAEVE